MKKIYTLLLSCILIGTVNAQFVLDYFSPDKNLRLSIAQQKTGALLYSLGYKNQVIIKPSKLGFKLTEPAYNLTFFDIKAIDSIMIDETWQPVWGELSNIRNHCNQLKLALSGRGDKNIMVNIVFRLFDDGLGFRYEFPGQANLNHFIIADELTEFSLAGDHKTFWIPGNYDTNEFPYNTTLLSEVDAEKAAKADPDLSFTSLIDKNAVQTPLMMKSANGLYINIHEAALLNHPAMDLLLDKASFTLKAQLVPDAYNNKAYLQTPAVTPWRTIIVSDKATDILASKLILNLNEPSVIKDPSFITPQKMIGVWWEMHVNKSTWEYKGGRHGANTANVKRYIDFATTHHIPAVLVEGWDVGWEDWYGKWKENVFDFITPYPDYDINELTNYARSKGVKIIMHHETSGSVTNYERYMDTAYRFMIDHNMNAVKTGYVGRIIPRGEHHDGQWMVNHYVRVAAKTAAYKIMVDMHEPVRPTGLHRTYPNWLACEAARGNEFNAWSKGSAPDHETILPFTRLMGGPMDYTPGIFHMTLNQYDTGRKTMIHTTLAKQLALYITIYSPLQMAADLLENYEKHLDAFKFIEDVATDWDDTKIIEAEPGDYITIARKAKGTKNWFVGGITDEHSRSSTLNCDFLDAGKKYTATIYRDADNADWEKNPEAYTIERKNIDNKTRLTIREAAGGGYAISIIAQ